MVFTFVFKLNHWEKLLSVNMFVIKEHNSPAALQASF